MKLGDYLKCPNCNAEVFEGDKFCGNCGTPLTEDAKIQSDQHKKVDINLSPYLKALFKTPSRVIEKPNQFNTYTILTTLAVILLILGGLSFVYYEGFYLNFGQGLSIFLRAIFIYLGILIGYGLAMIGTSYISSSVEIRWKTILKSYMSLSVYALLFYVLSMLVSIIGISYLPNTFNIIALITLSLGTYYIYKQYVQTNEKFDSFFVLLIHIVLTGLVTHIIYQYWIIQIWNSAFNF